MARSPLDTLPPLIFLLLRPPALSAMFGLTYETPPTWIAKVIDHTDTLLLDQAHLEKKAASIAMALMFRFPATAEQHAALSVVVREELEHFEQVLALMRRRGITYQKQPVSPYTERLLAVLRSGGPERDFDRILCCAVIEARSCERLKLLGEALVTVDPELSAFYLSLVKSEAQHFDLYLKIAETRYSPVAVQLRLREIMDHEAEVLRRAPTEPRLHN